MYVRTRCDDASPIHTCRLPPPRTALRSAIVRCNACALRRGGIRERCRAGSGCTFTHTRVGNPPHTTCGPSSASLSAVARSHGNVHSGAHVESERTLSHLYEFELQLAPFCVEDGATAHARCQHGVRTRHRVTGRRPRMRASRASRRNAAPPHRSHGARRCGSARSGHRDTHPACPPRAALRCAVAALRATHASNGRFRS